MRIFTELIDNPNNEFWIWNKRITNNSSGRVYPSRTTNVGSGVSVAVYRKNDQENNAIQIAQLQLPDYDKLKRFYTMGKVVNLDYTYIDNFSWLGTKKPYEVEGSPFDEHESISIQCSILNGSDQNDYIHIMHSEINKEDLVFSYSGFFDIKLDITGLTIQQGNIDFSNAHFYQSEIAISDTICKGNRSFSSEVSFRYISAISSNFDAMLMSQRLSMDFLDAKTENSSANLDPYPYGFHEITFIGATFDNIIITNAEIEVLSIVDANIRHLEFTRCKFDGASEINAFIQELYVKDSLNANVFKLSLKETRKLTFEGTINNGKFCFANFPMCIEAILRSTLESPQEIAQLLMLKENFRQSGECENEDACHLQYHRLLTKCEKNVLMKVGRYILDGISGYGTKPLRMLFFIFISILLFGTLYYFAPCFAFHGANTWIEHVYTSGITFFAVGYGDLFPLNTMTKMLSLIEAFWGLSATSYFLVVLSRKVIR